MDEMKQTAPVVYVVTDDSQVSRAVTELVQTLGHQVRTLESSKDFLEKVDDSRVGCLVLDLQLSEAELEVSQRLLGCDMVLPVIVLTAVADTPSTVRSLRNGAIAVLDKPFRDDELRGYVQEAITHSEQDCRRRNHLAILEERLKRLSPQDRSVLKLMLEGMKNRSIAARLDVSLRTVENRRRRVFDTMHANSVAQLTRMIVEYEHSLLPVENSDASWLALPFEKEALVEGR